MAVQRHYAKQWREELKAIYREKLEADGERTARQLARILKEILNKTLRFSSQFGSTGFRDVEIDIEYEVKVSKKGLAISLNALMLDSSGKPHLVWHIIAFGRKRFVQRRNSPPIRARLAERTIPNTLTVNRFPGYSGDVFVIPAGTVVEGIEPRNWYPVAAKEFKQKIRQFPSIQTLQLRFIRSDVRKPRL